ASLQDGLNEIESRYEALHPDIDLIMNYGSSGALQKQIEQGAPVDLFISAGKKQMDALVSGKLLAQTGTLLGNRLVLIASPDDPLTITDLRGLADNGIRKIAVGEPDTVPAGAYAKEALANAAVWDAVQPKLVFAKDVRQVLTYVESGNTEAGIVYLTDALASGRVKVVAEVPSGLYAPIVYPYGIMKASERQRESKQFIHYLFESEAAGVFAELGFTPPPAP
ncbi:molybdate ABC transporter substrate-binding protein, partial [Paenibacillus darwinianus]